MAMQLCQTYIAKSQKRAFIAFIRQDYTLAGWGRETEEELVASSRAARAQAGA